MRITLLLPLAGAAILAAAVTWAAPTELVRVDNLSMRQIVGRTFTLDREQELELGGVKLRRQHTKELMGAWIIDAGKRTVVWQLGTVREFRVRSRTAHFEDRVRLPAGTYELYVATFPTQAEEVGFWDWLWSMLSFDLGEPGEHVEQVELWFRGEGRHGEAVTPESVRSRLAAGALVAFTCVGDNARLERGFEVREPVELDLEATGEVTRSEIYDGARILDADTRRSVWVFERERSAAAGGADKNRRVTTTVRLNEGRYVAQYWSDDSHSCPRFLAAPPYDPFAWGLVIRPRDPARLAGLSPFDYQDPYVHAVVAALTRVGDDESRRTGFALARPLDVLVRAVGEGRGDEMVDYGWIQNADTRETVWAMRYRSTEPAGGAAKNRVEEQLLSLPAGRYTVHYVTDGSHSFDDWNSPPPSRPEEWGVVVAAAEGGVPKGAVTPFDADSDPGAVARIQRVGNNASESHRFQVERETRLLVVAVGEGTGGEMHDYGWITEAGSGRTVWEMRYEATESAGGAGKNRLAREPLTLAPGSYELHYTSDGSHAFGRWNDAPPFDPDAWGIGVYTASRPAVLEDPGTTRR